MTIWIFGDSFSRHFKSLPDTWVERLSTGLNQKIRSFARPTNPLEHTFFKFDKNRNNIQQNDIIIFTITNIHWRWFDKENPYNVTDHKDNAYENYEIFLSYYIELHKVYLTNFLFNLNDLTRKLNLHTIVIENFFHYETMMQDLYYQMPYIHFAKGILSEASDREWKKELIMVAANEATIKWDGRLNHFIRSNHIRIADKIIDNIKNKNPIDFTQGLITDYLDHNIFNDVKFREYELFEQRKKI